MIYLYYIKLHNALMDNAAAIYSTLTSMIKILFFFFEILFLQKKKKKKEI